MRGLDGNLFAELSGGEAREGARSEVRQARSAGDAGSKRLQVRRRMSETLPSKVEAGVAHARPCSGREGVRAVLAGRVGLALGHEVRRARVALVHLVDEARGRACQIVRFFMSIPG